MKYFKLKSRDFGETYPIIFSLGLCMIVTSCKKQEPGLKPELKYHDFAKKTDRIIEMGDVGLL